MSFLLERAWVRGLPIAFRRWGPPDRPLLLCLHGFLDHGGSFAPIAEPLMDRWQIAALDFRGHGRSGWIGDGGYYHYVDYVSDALAVIEAIGAPRISLLAHSMGGGVALMISALLGERIDSLVLLEGMGPPAEDSAVAPDRLSRWVTALGQPEVRGTAEERRRARRPMPSVDDAAARLRRVNPRLGEARARALAEEGVEARGEGFVWRFDPLHRTPSARPFDLEEVRHFWTRLERPVFSLYGDQTEWLLPDLPERHRGVKNVRVGVVIDSGHNIHHDRPDVVAAAVERWLAGDHGAQIAGIRESTESPR